MDRRAKPAKVKARAKRPPVGKAPTKDARAQELEKRLAESLEREKAAEATIQVRDRALVEALEQQTATSEILRVISRSPTDVQPVLEAVAESAARLCKAPDVSIFLQEADHLRVAARHGPIPSDTALPLSRETGVGWAVLEGRTVHIGDMQTEVDRFPASAENARRLGFRTALNVPLIREGVAIGAISLRRAETHLFDERQVALLETFANQAVIAIENVRLFTQLQQKNEALTQAHAQVTEALEQQTATSEILRVISSSPADVQPVFDAIAANAARLCDAVNGLVIRFDGHLLHLAAHYNVDPERLAAVRQAYPRPPSRGALSGRAILTRTVIHVPDVSKDAEYTLPAATTIGYRSVLAVPMMHDGVARGTILVARDRVAPFSDTHIALIQTFADQAVIAIQNVRLFTELQTSNRELITALDTQTATSDILRVISRSQTDVQPVFDALVSSAVRLLRGYSGMLTRVTGDQIDLAAHTSTGAEGDAALTASYPRTLEDEGPHAMVVRERATLNVADAQTDPRVPERMRAAARLRGYRSAVVLPLLRHDEPLGAIAVTRHEPGGFTDDEIALLQTFADQAVIAIENVRLFTELQTRNRELTRALDTQTATSDILRVISRSQTDVQPVFDAIVASAVRLLGAYSGALTRVAGDQIALAALTSSGDDTVDADLRAFFPHSVHSGATHAQAIRNRLPFNIADAQADPRVHETVRAYARSLGYYSQIVVPMLRQGEAIGAIAVTRREPGGFTDDEIALLRTFADQAVIAIENARLLTELQARTQELTRSVGELQALGDVGQAISSTLDLETVLSTIVARATTLADADAGVIYEYDEQREIFEPRATERLEDDIVQALVTTPVRKGQGATGRLAEVREPIQVTDVRARGAQLPVRDVLIRAGYQALLAVPLVREDHLIGGLTVFRKTPGEFHADIVELLKTFATQSSLAIQNARLFREIEVKSRELEVASQHKSEFLASMSHELRTPLNAIIGFSDVLLQGMFGEMTEKQTEYLQDILASGQHLLSLINDILDLSKIEAGRMELDVAGFDLPTAVDDALLLMRERAGRRGIALERQVDERLGEIRADQRKVKQVLLNLLSNAVKFTPEGGRIEVRAGVVDGTAEISVADTGIGIAPEDHHVVFEEFRQVGKADKKAEGTGLGLALCRKFVELHGGRIWVKSEIGVGATFTFTLPLNQ